MATTTIATAVRDTAELDGGDYLPRRKDGQVKRRTNREEKLCVLFPGAEPQRAMSYLRTFVDLFAFRKTTASITKNNQGPRSWIAIQGLLSLDHIIRHLLADRLPTLPVKWVAVRSLATSRYFVLDVDPDRGRAKPCPSKPSFKDRCQCVESCLALLGIDASDPNDVLIQPSPSGGRHYFVFLDQSYTLDNTRGWLEAAGLRFTKGQIEFYPSKSHPIRLPFGFMPLNEEPHPWPAWIKFIIAYRRGRIKRHSLAEFCKNLELHRQQQYEKNCPEPGSRRQSEQTIGHQPPAPTASFNGIPRRFRPTLMTHSGTQAEIRYRELVRDGLKSTADAQELMELGILQEGTRNQALMHLAAHLIFIRGHSADQAAAELITWAMNPRHKSKDIQQDLAKDTNVVEKEIIRMCLWHESRRDPARKPASAFHQVGFAPAEINHFWKRLSHLSPEQRRLLAAFLLHFLNFAKQYGAVSKLNSGREATPAVNAVIRKWPGCHHMHYKKRIGAAIGLGLLAITKGYWHNPNGKGRPKMYHLAIPITNKNEWTVSYDDALNQLTNGPVVASGVQADRATIHSSHMRPCRKEMFRVHRHHNRRTYYRTPQRRPHHYKRVHTALVRPKGSRTNLAPRSRQCSTQSDANPGLRGPTSGELPAFRSIIATGRGISLSGQPP